jgi:hypothetical protein
MIHDWPIDLFNFIIIIIILGGACGFGYYGKIVNDGSVAAVSAKLWKNGEGCGACYQVCNFLFSVHF